LSKKVLVSPGKVGFACVNVQTLFLLFTERYLPFENVKHYSFESVPYGDDAQGNLVLGGLTKNLHQGFFFFQSQ